MAKPNTQPQQGEQMNDRDLYEFLRPNTPSFDSQTYKSRIVIFQK